MKKIVLSIGLGVAALALCVLTPADAAEPEVETTPWVFDAKVIMVRTATPEVSESAPAWARGAGGLPVVTVTWATLLEDLKKRGDVTILLDGVTTTVTAVPTEIENNHAMLIDTFERRDNHNEHRKASTVNEGITVKLLPMPDLIQYETVVNWILPGQTDLRMPLQGRWRVKGAWGHARERMSGGKTLVLSHREQVRELGGPPAGLEIYAFLTARSAAR